MHWVLGGPKQLALRLGGFTFKHKSLIGLWNIHTSWRLARNEDTAKLYGEEVGGEDISRDSSRKDYIMLIIFNTFFFLFLLNNL